MSDSTRIPASDPTSIKPFHGPWPGMPDLFHTYCSQHPDFGTCAAWDQAALDVREHVKSEHPEVSVEQSGAEAIARIRASLDRVPDSDAVLVSKADLRAALGLS